ncbi:hypothetical protein HanXRQr2_Chr02g0055401 [Helianthus annuus]|uniref:Uncharacterized protein n=1 Tax=Helianthus annuus TaxID=4232 RepID=A0A9K3JM85_HELAN|nr:hypothetical protein HanXRQr2_Chr02g0055401 [Helianthus annuus]
MNPHLERGRERKGRKLNQVAFVCPNARRADQHLLKSCLSFTPSTPLMSFLLCFYG